MSFENASVIARVSWSSSENAAVRRDREEEVGQGCRSSMQPTGGRTCFLKGLEMKGCRVEEDQQLAGVDMEMLEIVG